MARGFRGLLHRDAEGWDGHSGAPHSSNGASSFHLAWDLPAGEWVEMRATLQVDVPPSTSALCFWALQVGFGNQGHECGAGHLGLQWHSGHPGKTAVNWGGYDEDGTELRGSGSPLPSATGNVNTRDLAWVPGRRYQLRIRRPSDGGKAPMGHKAWRGEVLDDLTGAVDVVRELFSEGSHLSSAVVWTENFGSCDEPSTQIKWSGLEAVNVAGEVYEVDSVRVNYQALSAGGCVDTNSSIEDGALVQRTSTTRLTEQGSVLRFR
jgi:hypothetical protein